jgi:antagonist of KipI
MSFIGKISVDTPGLLTTIQDQGRVGYRRFGVPVGGVMDDYAASLANLLVGNNAGAPLLEITLTGPELTFHQKTAVVVTGADMSAAINGRTVPMYQTIGLSKGDKLSFGKLINGCRTYLAVGGGLIGDYVMGSCATYFPAGFGGQGGKPLDSGSSLFFHQQEVFPASATVPPHFIPVFKKHSIIRLQRGPEWIGDNIQHQLEASTFTVSKDADRMGVRLLGKVAGDGTNGAMVSVPLAPGVIQMVPSGELIIAMKDGQTTGGYPRIASVISADLGYVAQLKPGDKINFRMVNRQEAKGLFLRRAAKLEYINNMLSDK